MTHDELYQSMTDITEKLHKNARNPVFDKSQNQVPHEVWSPIGFRVEIPVWSRLELSVGSQIRRQLYQ